MSVLLFDVIMKQNFIQLFLKISIITTPNKSTILRIVHKFEKIGSVENRLYHGDPIVLLTQEN